MHVKGKLWDWLNTGPILIVFISSKHLDLEGWKNRAQVKKSWSFPLRSGAWEINPDSDNVDKRDKGRQGAKCLDWHHDKRGKGRQGAKCLDWLGHLHLLSSLSQSGHIVRFSFLLNPITQNTIQYKWLYFDMKKQMFWFSYQYLGSV